MKIILISIPLICLAFSPARAQELQCEDIKPGLKSLKVMFMQPVRRDNVWLEGEPGTVHQTACAPDGLKTEESEYQNKTPVSKNRFVRKTREEIKALCKSSKPEGVEDKVDTSFGEDTRAAMDNFCRENLKREPDAVLIYDAASAQNAPGASNLLKQYFRFRDSKGLLTEQQQFDPFMTLEIRTVYKYKGKNELAEKTDFDPDGRQLRQEVYAFSKAANTRTVTVLNEHSMLLKKTVSEFRKDGTRAKETATAYDAGEQPLSKSEIYCDEKGSPNKEESYEGSSENPVYEYRYAYKYDKNGNWTEERKARYLTSGEKRLEDKSTAPHIVKREITYY